MDFLALYRIGQHTAKYLFVICSAIVLRERRENNECSSETVQANVLLRNMELFNTTEQMAHGMLTTLLKKNQRTTSRQSDNLASFEAFCDE